MLILRYELNAATPTLRYWRGVLVYHFEEESHCCARIQSAHLPLSCVAHSNFSLGHGCVFHIERHTRTNSATDFQFARAFHFDRPIESHLQFMLLITDKDALESLFEQRRIEGVSHDHVSAGRIATLLHLQETGLIQRAGVNVDAVTVCSRPQSQRVVVFDRLFHVASIVFLNVVM